MSTEHINWGILGTGRIAREFADALRFVSDAIPHGVASRKHENAITFSHDYQINKAFGSYEEMLADPTLDIVYVATPHLLHHEHCILALNAGKAVLCEKPFTINASQAEEIISLARRKKLFCMEAMWMRFIPAMRSAIDACLSGDIGEPTCLTGSFGTPLSDDSRHRQLNPDLAGGSLLDLGVYPLSLAHQLFGPPTDIKCTSSFSRSGVDDLTSALLTHAGNKFSIIQSSLKNELPTEAVITGSEGTLKIHAPLYRPHKITRSKFKFVEFNESPTRASALKSLIKRVPPLQRCAFHLHSLATAVGDWRSAELIPFTGNGYNYEIREVHECLKSGKLESLVMPLDETLAVMKSLDSIRQQLNSGH